MTERINGIKINIKAMDDAEQHQLLHHAVERLERAQGDVDRIMAHIALRTAGYEDDVPVEDLR